MMKDQHISTHLLAYYTHVTLYYTCPLYYWYWYQLNWTSTLVSNIYFTVNYNEAILSFPVMLSEDEDPDLLCSSSLWKPLSSERDVKVTNIEIQIPK